ncbi:major facilitator superfamily domain-containing protein [Mycotypha africana]|uniref:major facilitator superfamily domain-containing protein n=1 Tax=Mycotypha africana TaxID=64632 RepID=UPI0023007A45|nr:major facilitator superfamily domain-containing protein [Mycotypha africana]KAI8973420.1 major facilitator superfamily domain-containing protein [Mycotypha africana]
MNNPNTTEKDNFRLESGVIKRQSYLLPGALVTTLFFLWGFSYGLLDTLNKHFRNVLGISTTETTYMQVAYFGAYFVMSIPASILSKRFGYKRTIILGLALYVIGALCFYPSAVNLSFGGFVASLFVIATGLATLENCANAYITIIGSRKNVSLRINIAQGFNGLASCVAPIVASYAFFGGSEDTTNNNLDSVKWTYIGVACGVFCIAVLFCFTKIPEVDEEAIIVEEAKLSGEVARRPSLLSPHLLLGALAQFMYTGAQVCVASLFMFYSNEVGRFPDSRGSILLSVGQACFTVGRFVAAILLKKYRAEYLMSFFALAAIVANIFVIAMKTTATTYALIVIMFFESIMFPTIFALATRDLGRNHKRGSALVIMGVSGGAVLPPVQAVIHDKVNINISFVIPLIAFVAVFFYSIMGSKWIRYVVEDLSVNADTMSQESKKKYVDNPSNNTTGSST